MSRHHIFLRIKENLGKDSYTNKIRYLLYYFLKETIFDDGPPSTDDFYNSAFEALNGCILKNKLCILAKSIDFFLFLITN